MYIPVVVIIFSDRNRGFWKSEIGPISIIKKKQTNLMGLKSPLFQESGFHESGEGDRGCEMGTHFPERSGSLENVLSLCYIVTGFCLCPAYLWILILVAVR